VTILGIETATVGCSTSVVMDGRVVAESISNRPRAHAESLLAQVDEVLRKAALELSDIDGLAVSIGPGSFTGLRIGLSVAKGLAWSTGKPLAGVSTLKALALKARDSGEVAEGKLLLTAIDSRKGDVYCRLDRMTHGGLVSEWGERSVTTKHLLSELPTEQIVATGETDQLKDGFVRSGRVRILSGDVTRCSAGTVALEGEAALKRGERLDLRTLEPTYIKEFEPGMKSTAHMSKDFLRQP